MSEALYIPAVDYTLVVNCMTEYVPVVYQSLLVIAIQMGFYSYQKNDCLSPVAEYTLVVQYISASQI